ncbi:MAG: hypothetical protein QNJ88_16100 [Acidimicrobiia bacterium]|nr:hypothetical protein [Acidimicrobiia bacterium]
MDARIPSRTLELDITRPGIEPGSLGSALAGGPTLLIFLRHFG